MSNDGPPTPSSDDEKRALDHAWAWFSLHAAQRMQCINYFLVAVALLVAAYGTAIKEERHAIAFVIALLGVLFSASFNRLETRTKDLVKLGEEALKPLQERLASRTNNEALRLVYQADVRRPALGLTYAKIIFGLQIGSLIGFAAGAVYALRK